MRIPMLVGLAGLLMVTNAAAQDVSWDYVKGTDFTRFRTYAWTAGHPDALVAYYAGFEKNLALNEIGSGWGGPHFGGTFTNRARVEEITVGSIIVDIIDANARSIVWRGTASKDLDVHAKPKDRDKQVNKAMRKLFTHYPGDDGR